jgi:hypothetical protein
VLREVADTVSKYNNIKAAMFNRLSFNRDFNTDFTYAQTCSQSFTELLLSNSVTLLMRKPVLFQV